jgi:hypothetical protein
VPEPRSNLAWEQRRQRSRELTHEIAAVLREIRAVLTVPLDQRGDEWKACVSTVQRRKAALIAEIEVLAAEWPVKQDPCKPLRTRALRTAGPEVEP